MSLEKHFSTFRENIIGQHQWFTGPEGEKRILYADWTASGRMYAPIEDLLKNEIAPFVGNTHTETSVCGTTMTKAYHEALHIIKHHVNAGKDDAIITYGSGMTAVVNKLQRMLGLRIHEKYREKVLPKENDRPIVFITHMEHHSNQTSWLETLADVRVIDANAEGLPDLNSLKNLLEEFKHRPMKIAAVTSCSNVTGVFTPYHEIATVMHEADGLCFVDFACSAPYITIDMHPKEYPQGWLDAIYFSPHKFLGGPGTSGVLVFNTKLYTNKIPDNPGGGTVDWTNPWGEHKYVDDIEAREDGGTPGFMQAIRTALCIRLKEKMGVENIMKREEELLSIIWPGLSSIEGLHLLADNHPHRLGVLSFYVEGCHYNLAVKLLNDKYGIQVRGGCSCAGTYGHYLLEVSYDKSKNITDKINQGILTEKPGWVRMSIHPTMSDQEAKELVEAVKSLAAHHREWVKEYDYSSKTNEFTRKNFNDSREKVVLQWFS
ncbi:MAG TPA: selenocysteine lyase [Flavobacteriales bacterium]|nr:selenocysteine lyase [Flavobacteriales bacterium]HRE73572.1 aminotransferase class V-fold PLP-dependent enzyme [Flavobacteriales bacterium]HRJ37295.1 aminotransferase class V-fold PLP-dependent enzyme [Flavobacteriales bacterium]